LQVSFEFNLLTAVVFLGALNCDWFIEEIINLFRLVYGYGGKGAVSIDHWTADDGLPQNSVYSHSPNPTASWLATVDGGTFDGARFTVLTKPFGGHRQ
jgi:hypothetical protein